MKANAIEILVHHRDQAAAYLAEARGKLARDAATSDSHDLAYVLALLAGYEGQMFVLSGVLRLLEAGKAGEVGAWLVMHATRGAEDSWSGRTNDAARSRFDGVCAAIREVGRILPL